MGQILPQKEKAGIHLITYNHARPPTPKWKGTVTRRCYHFCLTGSARAFSSTAIMAIAVAPGHRRRVAVAAARGAWLLRLLLATDCWLLAAS